MQVIYRKTILDKINEVIVDARRQRKGIERILLAPLEFNRLEDALEDIPITESKAKWMLIQSDNHRRAEYQYWGTGDPIFIEEEH